MKKLLLATAVSALAAGGAFADEIKIGVLLGFTGPIDSITPMMANSADNQGAERNSMTVFSESFRSTTRDESVNGDQAVWKYCQKRID